LLHNSDLIAANDCDRVRLSESSFVVLVQMKRRVHRYPVSALASNWNQK